MFGPFIVAFNWIQAHIPRSLSSFKPKFNFITLHYTYLITMTLIGSIIIYPAHDMPYIDALFFASGCATQSGLNTYVKTHKAEDIGSRIDSLVQVAIMLIASVCTPIFINTSIVFIRLYWFEKRFQHVVLEARSLRRNKTRSRTKSEAKVDLGRDIGHEEHGVGNREIVVIRAPNGQAKGKKIEDEDLFREGKDDQSNSESSRSGKDKSTDLAPDDVSPTQGPDTSFHRDIVFADELISPHDRLPEKNTKEQNIAFVENQRNPTDKGTLRIPGPRDFDLGYVPQRIEEGEDGLVPQTTNLSDENQVKRERSNSVPPTELNQDDHPIKSHITFDPSDNRRRPHTGPSAYNRDARGKTSDSESDPTNINLRSRTRGRTFGSFLSREKEEEQDPMPYLSWQPTVGRNSAFVDLTEAQREELGGIEYRSLKMLAIILVCYYVGFHLFGMIVLLPWMLRDQHYVDILKSNAISPVWWAFFTPASMFNDLGFTLTPDSMVSFQKAVVPLLLGTFLIIIGNTGFPCMLRFIIWITSRCVPHGSGIWEELRFLLDHPRRCFTLLFPSNANWWLFWVLILLNGIDLIFFVILDLNDSTVTSLPSGFRFLDGLFQASATRTAGFAVVPIADLHPAIQVSYLIMMYISVFPIAISLRNTNVYEEYSLGVWATNEDQEGEGASYVGTHLRRQLSFDLWYVFLGFFLIAIIEGSRLENTNEYAFTLFSVLFEIVSAYGTVGLSLGYPGINASFSAEFRTLSKLIIIAMQIRGRHRGLPYALDRAILLPSESLHKKEDEDAVRRARRNSNASEIASASGGNFPGTLNGLNRRGSNATLSRGIKPQQVGRFLSGALKAGPSIPREKKA